MTLLRLLCLLNEAYCSLRDPKRLPGYAHISRLAGTVGYGLGLLLTSAALSLSKFFDVTRDSSSRLLTTDVAGIIQ